MSVEAVQQHFATATLARQFMGESVRNLINIIRTRAIIIKAVWIDGSFISLSESPNDVDIVFFVDSKVISGNRKLFGLIETLYLDLDIKWVPILEESGGLSTAINQLERMKWFFLFSSDRNGLPKGFVSLLIN